MSKTAAHYTEQAREYAGRYPHISDIKALLFAQGTELGIVAKCHNGERPYHAIRVDIDVDGCVPKAVDALHDWAVKSGHIDG